MLHFSQEQARTMLLAAQGVAESAPASPTQADLLATIRRMGALQIDTIHVIARSPYLVLWSRLGAYEPYWLDQLLAEGALFEYWSHAACFLPIEDFALYRGRMLAARQGNYPELVEQLLEHVRAHGPVRSADFAREGRGGTWWDWKPEKVALETLFDQGRLMVARRDRFQRIYDLQERVLPSWDDRKLLAPEQVRRQQLLTSVRALGVTPARWVADYFRLSKQGIAATLTKLADQGALLRATIAGWDEPAYLHPGQLSLAEVVLSGSLRPSCTTLLSPFDPVVWDRARARDLFNFDYRIEVYTPAAQRVYGYFTLPILHHGQLIGRLDPKAHRAEGRFELRNIHLEPWINLDEDLVHGLAEALRGCALWHATPEVMIVRSDPPELAEALRVRLRGVVY